MERTRNNSPVMLLIALILFDLLFVFFLYTFLHELGHALAGWFFGQSLTVFDVSFWDLSAHVCMTGGQLTQAQLAMQSAAGMLLPLLTWASLILIVPRKVNFTAVFIVVENINTTFFDLSVNGPDGYREIVLHGEGYRSKRDGGLWQEILPPGTYQLVLTSNESPGTVSLYWKVR